MNIFIVFHSNHLSVKFYFTNIFLSSSGWLLSFSRLKQTLKVMCHNKCGFSQNCRGKYGRSLILKTTDIWLLLTGQPQRKKLALVRVFPVLVMLMLLPEAPLRPMKHCLPLSLSCPSYTQFLVLLITLEFQEGNLIFFFMDYLNLSASVASFGGFSRILVPLKFLIWSFSIYVLCPYHATFIDLMHSEIFRSKRKGDGSKYKSIIFNILINIYNYS